MSGRNEKNLAVTLQGSVDINELYGRNNVHLNKIAAAFDVSILTQGPNVNIIGSTSGKRRLARQTLEELAGELRGGTKMSAALLERVIDSKLKRGKGVVDRPVQGDVSSEFNAAALRMKNNMQVVPRNASQAQYLADIRSHDVIFGVGPAGTGKTYLAIAAAVHLMENDENIKKIILVRPAVEAGEKLGFLPGDLKEKIDPYMQPLYDALYDMKGKAAITNLLKDGTIEIAPLAYMRGRTLKNAVVILDEAQNTTVEQMKMFLTRMGENSKMIVTGDASQIDLPKGTESGLVNVLKVMKNLEGVSIHSFHSGDVVRHPMVGRMVKAYEEFEKPSP